MSLIEALNWRYATKKMNGEAVQQEKVDMILEAARLAPTSSGLQPFKIIAISNPDKKKELMPLAFNQPQIVDASHVLIFAAWDNYTHENIDEVFNRTNAERGIPASATEEYVARLKGMLIPRTAEENFQHAARQAYIGFGMAIAQAAMLKVDTTPMEGFDNAKVDEFLGLREKGLRSVSILTIGYRDAENDWLVNLKKVRQSLVDFVIEYK
ncbi:NAD(P)H-dependent oxidoreductase [Pedobacter montanisoli]|uniref:NAD(P)H-dependent oxidoreductase n=1 Tax=Pedobacter montanisoli TaxID=2923277 RepID=A0ABS9ZS37_9SPHI|nr:NAD(P)H-dependent oxidoreductase [Pedobacter montanisoli]MCJ0741405.1 NAD(P)H-dependent oxidoreductase [Pedobacter montanisoli]